MSEFRSLKIGIIDYSVGNLMSVAKVLEKLGVVFEFIRERRDLGAHDGIILPGVGSCGTAIQFLKSRYLDRILDEYVSILKKPVLGICLGFQIMCEFSEEDNIECLGWIKGSVRHLRNCTHERIKIPHMGWNEVSGNKGDLLLLRGLKENSSFYFAHSYVLPADENNHSNVGVTEYHVKFISLYESENVFGVQFHPEKSYFGGELVLRNFLKRVADVKG